MRKKSTLSLSHIPRKRFGQNFLTDQGVIHAIVNAIAPRTDDCLVEIGPGLGALTEPLLARLRHLSVVEIDRDLIAGLKKRFSPERLSLFKGDALAFDFSQMAKTSSGGGAGKQPLRVVGNLPYNISTPLLFHLATFANGIHDMHFMLQKEVVDRMTAAPGTSAYSRLSVMLQYRFHLEALFDVPPEAFAPPPKVYSAVVRLIPKQAAELTAADPECFARLVAAAFGQRRKMLRNTLADWFDGKALENLGISPAARAEALSTEDFVRLANVAPT